MTKTIGILGGTFDPIHNGHIHIATELLKYLPLDIIKFIPVLIPVHRNQPIATTAQRLTMLNLAIKDTPKLEIDERELHRSTPSYTVDTLLSLREEFPESPLCLIVGMDAFIDLEKWHRWRKLLELAHIVVVNRDHIDIPTQGNLPNIIQQHQTNNSNDLLVQPAGKLFFQTIPPIDVSATQIRERLANQKSIEDLCPIPVCEYIIQENIY